MINSYYARVGKMRKENFPFLNISKLISGGNQESNKEIPQSPKSLEDKKGHFHTHLSSSHSCVLLSPMRDLQGPSGPTPTNDLMALFSCKG